MNPEYLAGFMDGEGCFRVINQYKNGKAYGHATVIVGQSGEEGLSVLEEIQQAFGGRIYLHMAAGKHKATKPAYKLYWRKQEAIDLLPKLIPHLRVKKKDAEAVLIYLTRND